MYLAHELSVSQAASCDAWLAAQKYEYGVFTLKISIVACPRQLELPQRLCNGRGRRTGSHHESQGFVNLVPVLSCQCGPGTRLAGAGLTVIADADMFDTPLLCDLIVTC
jgi:hypothetical protein